MRRLSDAPYRALVGLRENGADYGGALGDAPTRSARVRRRCRRARGERPGPSLVVSSAQRFVFALELPRREPQHRRLAFVQVTAAVTHEHRWYVARALEVEVTSQGRTVDEALANLREALELYFEDETMPEGIEPPIIATVQLSA